MKVRKYSDKNKKYALNSENLARLTHYENGNAAEEEEENREGTKSCTKASSSLLHNNHFLLIFVI